MLSSLSPSPASPASSSSSEQLIEFHTKPEFVDEFPRPYPANQNLPEWLRQMPREGAPGMTTVKRCPPFVEAMTCGYIIPLATDITIAVHADRIEMASTGYTEPFGGMHSQDQFPGAPFANLPAIKFRNPWLIKTPPGYSTLFLPPVNRFDAPFMPFTGIVETDTYYRSIAFPAICLLQPGQQAVLKRGTPLVQAIPIRREAWSSTHGAWDLEKMNGQQRELDANPHMYREQHWQRKVYG